MDLKENLNLSGFYLTKHSLEHVMFFVFVHHKLYFESKLKTNAECCVRRYHPPSLPTTLKAVCQLFVAGSVFIRNVSCLQLSSPGARAC